MTLRDLPADEIMFRALSERDGAFDGLFYAGVMTTGIFCRPTCPARKPARAHVRFYPSAREALQAGFRPCKRCRPLDAGGAPTWLRPLLEEVEREPGGRWTDQDLRQRGLDPLRVRRWFKAQHGMTFQVYQRARRLGHALGQLRTGGEVAMTAYENGYASLSGFYEAFQRALGSSPGRSRAAEALHVTRLATPLGPMLAGATEQGLCLLEFAHEEGLDEELRRLSRQLQRPLLPGANEVLRQLEDELRRYFDGALREFSVPLQPRGTPFQLAAWESLCRIPYGQTRSYAQQAQDVGRPTAVRAVARANATNWIAIVIPCHRVVGADGRLSGYGGGVWRKQWLLDHERAVVSGRLGERAILREPQDEREQAGERAFLREPQSLP